MKKERVTPIILGGAITIPLEKTSESDYSGLTQRVKDHTPAAAHSRPRTWRQGYDPTPHQQIDVDRLWKALGLDSEELKFLVANKLDRIPRRLLASHLNWDSAKVEAVRVRLGRKIRRVANSHFRDDFVTRGNTSSQLVYRETVGVGKFCYSFIQLPQDFSKIMADEREYYPRRPSASFRKAA